MWTRQAQMEAESPALALLRVTWGLFSGARLPVNSASLHFPERKCWWRTSPPPLGSQVLSALEARRGDSSFGQSGKGERLPS